MHRTRALAACVTASALLAIGLTASPASSATNAPSMPTRVAVVILEDKDACSPTDGLLAVCGGGDAGLMPYLNGTIAGEGVTFTQMHEGITGLPCRDGHEPGCYYLTGKANYPVVFSGALCNDGCLGSTSPSLFGQMGNRGFEVFEEDWSNTSGKPTPRCDVGFAPPQRYAYSRLHNPATFWAGACRWRVPPRTVLTFPNAPAGAMANLQGPFAAFGGNESFARLDVVVPSLCHDQHDATCPVGDTNRTNAWGVIDSGPCTEGHQDGWVVDNTITAGDLWLCRNFEGIRRDVGSTGVVILTWDEDANKKGYTLGGQTAQGVIPTVIVPGEDAAGTPGVLEACPSPGSTGCVDTGDYDQTSLFKTLIDVAVGGSPRPCSFYARNRRSFDSCSDSAPTGRPAFDVRLAGSSG